MGRRKPFIDKKSATTYSLLYDDAEGTGGEHSHRAVYSGEVHADGTPNHSAIVAELRGGQEAAPVVQLPEERRREIVSLGFPDDGYDYLKHLKDGKDETQGVEPGTQNTDSTAEAPVSSGPRVFLAAPYIEPPPEDVKVIDARRLPQQQQAADDEDIFDTLREVAAFSHEVEEQNFRGGNEVDALTQMMMELERQEDHAGAEGHGDLLDDFVNSALASAPRQKLPYQKLATVLESESESEGAERGSDDLFDDMASSVSDDSHAGIGADGLAPHSTKRMSSIASTYLRPQRMDRTEVSSALDDRFEQLALDYDSDELGDLDELQGGGASLEDFQDLLNKCLAEQQSSQYISASGSHDNGGNAADRAGPKSHLHDDTPDTAVAKAKELVMSGVLRENDNAGLVEDVQVSCMWDCETVLSNYSNIDNHPGLLMEPNSRARRMRRSRRMQPEVTTVEDEPASADQASMEPAPAHESSEKASSMQRSKEESLEEKRQRKKLVKEVRREARVRKKSTKELYKESASCINLDPMHGQRRIAA